LRLRKDKRGISHVIEAFFAAVLLIACLALIPSQPAISGSSSNLSSTANNILLSLDGDGQLATLIDNRDWAALKSSVQAALPLTSWFNLTVFDAEMNCINDFPISNAGLGSGNVFSQEYVCVSQSSNFTVYVLRLQLSTVT
jgi:hypothetical protein